MSKLISLKTGEKVKILEVVSDLENGWYYTIVFKDGRERQTTYSHLGKIKLSKTILFDAIFNISGP